jgi:hypothetical protein
MSAPEPVDVPEWTAVEIGDWSPRECFADMVGMPEYCLLDGDTCGVKPCREWVGGVDQ